MPQISGATKKSETFQILIVFLLETCKSNLKPNGTTQVPITATQV